ncbi:MAG TPA: phosphotransferase [Gemmatimonadales bacterium]|nr:phosphotransferase [Gemmatimonadales bacterium]
MSKPPIAVLHDDLESHPALLAWRIFRSCEEPVQRIEVLRQHGVNAVFRLVGVPAAADTVIAKRMPRAKAQAERTMYERVLPHVPVAVPRYYGALAGDAPASETWLFLEDVGSERYSDTHPEHLALTARWVAGLHGSASAVAAARELPDGGPDRYYRHLIAAAEKLEQRLSGPGLVRDDVTLLRGVADQVRGLASRWGDVEELCGGLPATVVHGDFRPKNVYLRRTGNGLACYPIDWETAGWGAPAADLTRIDVAAYWSAAREWVEGLSLDAVYRLAQVGQVLRTIAAIDWECTSLRFESRNLIIQSLASLAVLTPRLTEAIRMTGVAA